MYSCPSVSCYTRLLIGCHKGEFSSPNEALQQVAISKRVPMERLTIPSQRRYVSYFASVMEGVRWGEGRGALSLSRESFVFRIRLVGVFVYFFICICAVLTVRLGRC